MTTSKPDRKPGFAAMKGYLWDYLCLAFFEKRRITLSCTLVETWKAWKLVGGKIVYSVLPVLRAFCNLGAWMSGALRTDKGILIVKCRGQKMVKALRTRHFRIWKFAGVCLLFVYNEVFHEASSRSVRTSDNTISFFIRF